MVTLEKSGDSAVKFVFTDSDHYLYGDGVVEVPVNALLLTIDESEMVTFKKLSGDPFISFRADNSNLGTKAAIEQFYKTEMVGSTGGGSESGITSGDVQTMIDNSLEDYYTDDEVDAGFDEVNSALTAVANDVSTLSGQVATKVATSDFNAYSAATDSRLAEDEEVTAAALNNLDETKQNALEYYSEDTTVNTATIHIENTDDGTVGEVYVDGASVDISALRTEEDEDNGSMVETHSDIWGNNAGIAMSYEKLVDDEEAAHSYLNVEEGLISMEVMANEETTNVDVYSNGVTINGDAVATEPYVDAAISGKVDTSAITSAITSASTNDEVAGAKAVYDAIQAGGGGGATYSAGTNISIDTANTINCTLPISVTSNSQNSIKIGNSGGNSYGNNNLLIGTSIDANYSNSVGIGTSITLGASNTLGLGKNITTANEDQLSCGFYNVSNKANSTKGDSGNTLVSVGNGYYHYPIQGYHNAFEIRQNGDLYFADTDNTTYQNYYEKPMVRLQDMYAALGGLKLVKLTQSEYDQLATKDANTLYIISNVVS